MFKLLSATLLCILFFCENTIAQPDIKMHRLQDTTKSASGWYFAKSTEGHFSVLIPIPFNDFTLTMKDAQGEPFKSYTIGGKSPEGISFSITETMMGKNAPETKLEDIVETFKKPGNTLSAVNKEIHEGRPAISFLVTRQKDSAYMKYVKTSTSIIIMILGYPSEYQSIVEQFPAPFFANLKLLE